MSLLPATWTDALRSRNATSAVAIALSMIVEITSLTPRVTLSTAATPAHIAPTSIATMIVRTMLSNAGQPALRGHDGGDERGQAVLPVDADVEQVHPEADRHGEPGEVEHGRAVDDVDEVARLRRLQDRLPHLGHRVTGRDQDQAGDRDRRHEREDRCGQGERHASRVEPHHATSAPAPVMDEPSSCGVTDAGSYITDQPTAEDHLDRVRQTDQLVEVGGDQQHGEPACGGRS